MIYIVLVCFVHFMYANFGRAGSVVIETISGEQSSSKVKTSLKNFLLKLQEQVGFLKCLTISDKSLHKKIMNNFQQSVLDHYEDFIKR